jgi:hypothetical protein
MLSILKFKKSLFAGALDGGEKEVFLGGSRLNRFMDSVEKATVAIPPPAAQDPPLAPDGDGRLDSAELEPAEQKQPPAPAAAPSNDPWSGLLQTGLAVLEQLAAAARGAPGASVAPATSGVSLVHRDDRTGENYFKIPVPPPEVLDRVLGAVGALLERFRK